MRLRCCRTGKPRSECEHCCFDGGNGEWGKSLVRLLDEWRTDRRDLWRRALELRQRRTRKARDKQPAAL